MADRNGNGIDDSREGGLLKGTGLKAKRRPSAPQNDNVWNNANRWNSQNKTDSRMPYRPTQDSNFLTDMSRSLGNFFGPIIAPGTPHGLGTGFGDYLVGSDPNRQPKRQASRGGTFGPPVAPQQETPMGDTALPSFLSNLMEALGVVPGSSGMDRVSYDPLREDARGRGAEYDARLNAMYNQLQNSIRQDGSTLQGSYQGAIDDTAERAALAQRKTQEAGDAAQARNMQQLEALGIGEAAGNQVAQGRDLNTQIAGAVQDAAARGQIAGDALQQNQQSAVQHNTNLVGAAGLEGNLQRARVQSELSNLLAQYDMQEQQANQEVDQFNASQRNQGFGQAMSLAEALTGNDWQQRSYQDELDQMIYEQQAQANQPNKLSQSMAFLQQLMSSPQFADQDIEAILPYITALGGVGKLV